MKELVDVSALRAFVAVSDAASFTTAAKRIGLTRSAVGKIISRLEETLGVRLLNRSTRSVGLTADGRILYERAAQILHDLAEVQDMVTVSGATPKGILRLTAPEAFGQQIVLPVIGEFLEQWPEVSVEASLTDRVIDLIEEGFDMAIRIGSVPTASDLISKVIGRSTAKLCASPSYLARHSAINRIADLEDHRQLVAGTRDSMHTWQLESNDRSIDAISMRPGILCDNASALRRAAINGLGIALLPRFLIENDVEDGRLEIILPEFSKTGIPISLTYPTRRHVAPKVRQFIQLLEDRMSKQPAD